ncbi:redoxin domain-containing protein [Pseudoflavitalea sp. X16]|uniref:thioredoxin-like domain-containing protein n=1 Tax=Paraflavitalea devenefica TaxID=2716334 RepID=UPI0014214535|nr:thioredoxin-like domain-containing protein [Paraflavitalea devenefica]NII29866.1 redoxin domain-containing protein [Paraflavitalea devenefica]
MTIKRTLATAIVSHLFYSVCFAQQNKVIIEIATATSGQGTYALKTFDLRQFDDDAKVTTLPASTTTHSAVLRWEIPTAEPIVMSAASQLMWDCTSMPLEPGDSVRITATAGRLQFTGKSGPKFELNYRLSQTGSPEVQKILNKRYLYCDSIGDFEHYFALSENMLTGQLDLIAQYENRVSALVTGYLKGFYLSGFRLRTASKFEAAIFARKKYHLPIEHFRPIYDTTLARYWPSAQDTSDYTSLSVRTARALKKFVTTKLNFDRLLAGVYEGNDEIGNYQRYYQAAKTKYRGLAQRKALSFILRSLLREQLTPASIALAEDFLQLPGYPDYHAYINQRLAVARRFEKGSMAPAFTLTSLSGKPVHSGDLRGKIVIMDFWFTGCVGCEQMTPALKKVEEAYWNNSKVVFLSISIDKDQAKWSRSIAQGRYTTGHGLSTFTGGKGTAHPIIADYDVSSYPTLFLIDADGRIVKVNKDPREDNATTLIQQIKNMLPISATDGPYVLYPAGNPLVKSVVEQQGEPQAKVETLGTGVGPAAVFQITDAYSGRSFPVSLQQQLLVPPTEYPQPSRLLAISDIEGNLGAFVSLLLASHVIDNTFNWTFGDGHLVLLGDFFDRGSQVTEVLWLVYSLEQKARQKGGWVHFILGNHELMNLSGDLRYVHHKYKTTASLLGEEYTTGLYGNNSELGRWLRTKNIVERIGNMLFTHGGISAEINRSRLSLQQINDMARPYYGQNLTSKQDSGLMAVMGTRSAPFWYRGYYESNGSAPEDQVDRTRTLFAVDKIVTGHTIIGDGEKITPHYNGKVINIDTHHASGHSAALLIEGNQFYTVDIQGRKLPLFGGPQPPQPTVTGQVD